MVDLDSLRSRAYKLLMSPNGNRLPPVRWGKNALLYANDLAGRPLASQQELDERREYELVEEILKDEDDSSGAAGEAAPVVLYHLDKHTSRLRKITDVLDAEKIPYEVLNLEEDLAAREAVERESRFPMPVVVIGGEAVGGALQVAKLAASGELKKRVYG
jgi:glutaredoxin